MKSSHCSETILNVPLEAGLFFSSSFAFFSYKYKMILMILYLSNNYFRQLENYILLALAPEYKRILMRLGSTFYLEFLVYLSLSPHYLIIWYMFCSFTWLTDIVILSRDEHTISVISVVMNFHLRGSKRNILAFPNHQLGHS